MVQRRESGSKEEIMDEMDNVHVVLNIMSGTWSKEA